MAFLDRFSRITTTGRRLIAEVDGLRFLAITSVVLYHIRGYTLVKLMDGASLRPTDFPVFAALSQGKYGVQLFFIISGFLLSLPFARHFRSGAPYPSLAGYFLRRVTRLEPPYLAMLALLFSAGLLISPAEWAPRWPNLLASAFYQHGLVFSSMSAINGVAWTLEIEVQFYVLAPLLVSVLAIRSSSLRRSAIASSGLCAILCRELFASPGMSRISLSLLGSIEFFLAGMLLADIYVADWGGSPSRSRNGDIAFVAGALVTGATAPWGLVAPWTLPIGMFVLCVGALRGTWSSRLLSTTWIVRIGGMCYSIYLFHFACISAAGRFLVGRAPGATFSARFLLSCAVEIPVILVGCGAFFFLVERPCMRPDWMSRLFAVNSTPVDARPSPPEGSDPSA